MIFMNDIIKITIDNFYEILKIVKEEIIMRRNPILLISKLQRPANTCN